MSFPPPAGMSESEVDPKTLVGQSGFKQIMTAVPVGQEAIKYKYKDGAERVFSRDQIGRWSNKIFSVCKHALECEGIVLVYTEYIEGGAVPVALALEEHGFKRFGTGNNNLLMNPTNPNPASGKRVPVPTYTMITGNKMLTPTSVVSVATAKNNTRGEIIKVIIITKAGSEGIDLKNIRQVHVIDPWYNLSLIEQVIGRAVRNCSHVDLPFEHRNVCIFIHGTRLGAGRFQGHRVAKHGAKLLTVQGFGLEEHVVRQFAQTQELVTRVVGNRPNGFGPDRAIVGQVTQHLKTIHVGHHDVGDQHVR
jgi:hypothetical protein